MIVAVAASSDHRVAAAAPISPSVSRAARQGLTPQQRAQLLELRRALSGRRRRQQPLVIVRASGSRQRDLGYVRRSARSGADCRSGLRRSRDHSSPITRGARGHAPIRLAYLRYVAEGPECGDWPTNLADERRNLPLPDFGCAQQHNLAAKIANPADLLEPRTMAPADAERRAVIFDKYVKGSRPSRKRAQTSVGTKGAN